MSTRPSILEWKKIGFARAKNVQNGRVTIEAWTSRILSDLACEAGRGYIKRGIIAASCSMLQPNPSRILIVVLTPPPSLESKCKSISSNQESKQRVKESDPKRITKMEEEERGETQSTSC